MSDNQKVQPSHLQRSAYVYVRQSTATGSHTTASPRMASTNCWTAPCSWVGRNRG